MASVGFLEIFLLAFLYFIFLISFISLKWDFNGVPWNWPILGMTPTIMYHIHRIHDRCIEVLEQTGGSFFFKGIWFANTDILLTADPANIHYIMSTNFHNYPKGSDFKYIFDILGDGIFNSDSDLWKNQRKIAHLLIHQNQFLQFLEKTTRQKVERGLVYILDSVSKNGSVIDLQDLFQRFTFDSTCLLVTGYDLNSLSIKFPEVPFSKAMDIAEEVIFIRHFIPKNIWELLKKLQLGPAKKLNQAEETINQTIQKLIALKREEILQIKEEEVDLLSSYMKNKYDVLENSDKFFRDLVLNFMLAGRDTLSSALSWFFFCISNNPIAETKIREELKSIIPENEDKKWRTFSSEELNKLGYLHGAICETLRLYPPVPFQHKVPVQADVLPSGHHVEPKTKISFSIFSLGRMKSVWGKDCMEFKPDRWITGSGKIKQEPSYKFLAFNAGPRTCLGKQVALIQMKMVAAAMLHNYNIIQEKGGHDKFSPSASIILHMKHGFKVKITKRWS